MAIRHVPAGTEPLRGLIMLAGPSNSGKTFTALRMATGIVKVLGGKIAMLDTELRGNLYEKRFAFDRFIMEPPFSPAEFIAAYKQLDRDYSVVITDNFSDEYEGPGGIAEIAANSPLTNDVAKWAKPKLEHKQLMARVRLLKAQHIFCLRAEDKIEIVDGEDANGRKKKLIRPLGWMPLAEKRFLFDVTLGFMLPPNSKGCPTILKTLEDLAPVFRDGEQINEAHGEALGRWVRGEIGAVAPVAAAPDPVPLTYDLDGEELPAPSWIDRAGQTARGLTNGDLRDWWGRHKPTRERIVADHPNLKPIMQALIAEVTAHAQAQSQKKAEAA